MVLKYLLLIVLFAMSSPIIALDSCMSGSWHDTNVAHQGINVEVLAPDRVLTYFYTYSFFDQSAQNWLVFVGPEDEMLAYDVVPNGQIGDGDFYPIEYEVGTGALSRVDNDTLIFKHSFLLELDQQSIDDPASPWCLNGGCDEVYVYTRLTQPIPCD